MVTKEEIRERLIDLIVANISNDEDFLEQFLFDKEGFVETIADIIQDYLLHEWELWADWSAVYIDPKETLSETVESIVDTALLIAEPIL